MRLVLPFLALLLILQSCSSELFKEVPEDDFIGHWKLEKRGIFDGIEIEIARNEDDKLKGKISKLNDNKYVQMFMEKEDNFIKKIKRYSNTEFDLTERKIAAPLFSIYGESTSNKVQVHFHHKDTIYIGEKGNKGKYIRVK